MSFCGCCPTVWGSNESKEWDSDIIKSQPSIEKVKYCNENYSL